MKSSRKEEALEEVRIHNTWFREHIIRDKPTIMVAPRYKLDYRDEYLPKVNMIWCILYMY
jgi:hypothetical protein